MVGKLFKVTRNLYLMGLVLIMGSCNAPTSVTETKKSLISASTQKFAGGTKSVRINLSTDQTYSSFAASGSISVPSTTTVPTALGGNGLSQYLPGVSATQYYGLDGETPIDKPEWLLDFQVGITTVPGSGCSSFGSSGALDVEDYFRVSEKDCTNAENGSGTTSDKVFFRVILDRDTDYIGSAENLLVQVEFQASGIVPYAINLDSFTSPEDMAGQVWKTFWSNTLDNTTTMKSFATFVPPEYSFCDSNINNGGTASDQCAVSGYKGASARVKQIMFPLSSYSDMNVIQFSRIKSWKTGGGANALSKFNTFCTTSNSPLCSGVVIRSVSLIRI